jgi:hypothetical protein
MTEPSPIQRATRSRSAHPRGRVLSRRHDDAVIQAELRRLAQTPPNAIVGSQGLGPHGDPERAPDV